MININELKLFFLTENREKTHALIWVNKFKLIESKNLEQKQQYIQNCSVFSFVPLNFGTWISVTNK